MCAIKEESRLDSPTVAPGTFSTRLAKARKTLAHYIAQPVVRGIARTGISPNTVTWMGFIVVLIAAVLAAFGHLLAGGLVMLFAGFFDMLDGALARLTNKTTRFGAVLDSTLDRLSEAAVLTGLIAFYAPNKPFLAILCGVAIAGSFMVSYVRARAEGLGLECQEGFFTRTERVIVLAIGMIINQVLVVLGIIIVLSFVTGAQRLLLVRQQTKDS